MKHLCRATALAILAIASSCSKPREDRLPVFPVTGTATYNGQPMKGASIVLIPSQPNPLLKVPPFGVVGADGSFAITSYGKGDGAPLGEYKVTFTWPDGAEEPSDLLKDRLSNPKKPSAVINVQDGDNTLTPIELKGPPVTPPGN